jgi:hypothetical protein
MSTEQPTGQDDQASARPTDRGQVSWLAVVAVIVPVALFVVLLRWAIDLLLLSSALLLLAHSTRDTFQDWMARESFAGEPDPVWAVGAVSAGVFGMVIAGFWLFASSHAGNRVAERYAPEVLTRAIAMGEQHGWGGRMFWPSPSKFISGKTAGSEARAATVGPFNPAGPTAMSGPADEGAGPAAASSPAPASTAGQLVRTRATLRASATQVPRGTPLTLTAVVTGSSRPSGTVVFRRGTTTIGTAPLDAEGRATLVATDLPPGTHDMKAEFLGSSALSPSRSGTVRIEVR